MIDYRAKHVFVSFTAAVALKHRDSGDLVLQTAERQFIFRDLSPALVESFTAMMNRVELSALVTSVLGREGAITAARLMFYLERFNGMGLIELTLARKAVPILTVRTIGRQSSSCSVSFDPEGTYVISRFALARMADDEFLIESPLSRIQAVARHESVLVLWASFRTPSSIQQAISQCTGLDAELAKAALQWLADALLLTPVIGFETTEDRNQPLAQWEFHDLLFHARSRDGRHSNQYGGTYPWLGWLRPLPACKPSESADIITLEKPPAKRSDLLDILERRRSIREYSETPIRLSQLSEFLFHSARVLEFVPGEDEITRRPYPSGGARYPLEVYVVANYCDGLQRGVYHYDPRAHGLLVLPIPVALVNEVLGDFRTYAARRANWRPQVAIVLTARFERVSWKYQSVAYALILKEVGALMQTMYLVATGMGLAPCAVGGGDSDLFARVTSSDYYAESAVGEFLLGLPA